jgi:hypothetical protein
MKQLQPKPGPVKLAIQILLNIYVWQNPKYNFPTTAGLLKDYAKDPQPGTTRSLHRQPGRCETNYPSHTHSTVSSAPLNRNTGECMMLKKLLSIAKTKKSPTATPAGLEVTEENLEKLAKRVLTKQGDALKTYRDLLKSDEKWNYTKVPESNAGAFVLKQHEIWEQTKIDEKAVLSSFAKFKGPAIDRDAPHLEMYEFCVDGNQDHAVFLPRPLKSHLLRLKPVPKQTTEENKPAPKGASKENLILDELRSEGTIAFTLGTPLLARAMDTDELLTTEQTRLLRNHNKDGLKQIATDKEAILKFRSAIEVTATHRNLPPLTILIDDFAFLPEDAEKLCQQLQFQRSDQ